ncbi:hypothetical protein N0V88_007175 [Collariella sp. IMI 366227]|nr:hypothetical protein N0V88_007175 [Collariella sp. IMI 366227]
MDSKTLSSRLRELVKFLGTVKGDLANVTGPPSLLAPSSVVEVGHCWAQRPSVFSAPALEPNLENAPPPEQVSHHPPITAMHVSDRAHGVRADGYARVEMTFGGASGVLIRQVGHATLRIERFDEDWLVPLPDVRVRGFLSGFYRKDEFKGRKKEALFEVAGCWSEGWTAKDLRTGKVIEVYEVGAEGTEAIPMDIELVGEQDPWESRRAWDGVLQGLRAGDMRAVVAEKSKIEQAQREMRASEARRGHTWEPLFFKSLLGEQHDVFHRLSEGLGWQLHHEKTKGVWKMDDGKVQNLQRPFRAGMTPFGY